MDFADVPSNCRHPRAVFGLDIYLYLSILRILKKKTSPGEEFYSLFYLGLYNDARGESAKAENYMRAAVKTRYATIVGSQDYMVDVAKVHCQVRGWTI